jgi:hypothetical protein
MDLKSANNPLRMFASISIVIGIFQIAACSSKAFDVVEPVVLRPPPIEVTVEQLSREFRNDPVTADTKYTGKKLLFNEVVVDGIHTIYNSLGAGMAFRLTTDYFTSGDVSFQLYDFSGALQRVQVGYVLKLEGTCQGLLNGSIRVSDCWYQSIKGELGATAFGAAY